MKRCIIYLSKYIILKESPIIGMSIAKYVECCHYVYSAVLLHSRPVFRHCSVYIPAVYWYYSLRFVPSLPQLFLFPNSYIQIDEL